MQPPYDAALREAVRLRMSPPNRESVAEIARDTGITAQTIDNWRSQWQKQGQLVPASTRPPEQWSAADKLAAVIQAAEDANGPHVPSMADQRDLQRKNQEQAREIGRLQRELEKKEKALTEAATLLMLSKKFNKIFQPDEEP